MNLDDIEKISTRDDCLNMLVPSDIRHLVSIIRQLQKNLLDSKRPLNDIELKFILTHCISHSNGFNCGRVLVEGVLSTFPLSKVCKGSAEIVNGKLKFKDICGEPCSYVCKNAANLAEDLENIIMIDGIIREARGI